MANLDATSFVGLDQFSFSQLLKIGSEMSKNLAAEILNSSSLLLGITVFILICMVTTTMTLHFVKKIHPMLPGDERIAVCWFVLSGFINLLFLGFVVLSGGGLVKRKDSRILWVLLGFGLENLQFGLIMLSCQIITATITAPLCVVVSHLIVRGDHLRHAFQLIACTCQLISMILHCGMILANLRFKLPRESTCPNMVIFQLVVLCFLAYMPDMLLQDSMASITKTYHTIAKINDTLRKHQSPTTPLQIRSRSVSTTAITITKQDIERSISDALSPSPSPSLSPGERIMTPTTPTKPIFTSPSPSTSEPPKIPFTPTQARSASNTICPSPLSTKKRPKLQITPTRSISNTSSPSPSKIPITPTRSSAKPIFKLPSIPDVAEEPSSPSDKPILRHLAREPLKVQQDNNQEKGLIVDLVKGEEDSDDEKLDEIVIDKIKIVEGLRKRKTVLARL